jgi:hypothetical protein
MQCARRSHLEITMSFTSGRAPPLGVVETGSVFFPASNLSRSAATCSQRQL